MDGIVTARHGHNSVTMGPNYDDHGASGAVRCIDHSPAVLSVDRALLALIKFLITFLELVLLLNISSVVLAALSRTVNCSVFEPDRAHSTAAVLMVPILPKRNMADTDRLVVTACLANFASAAPVALPVASVQLTPLPDMVICQAAVV